jgi:hypothetical protein
MRNYSKGCLFFIHGLVLTACSNYAESLSSAPDVTAPTVKLYLGTEPVNEPCNQKLEGHGQVSTRLLPFNLCAVDPQEGDYTSGLDKVCLKVGDTSKPSRQDECWKDLADIAPLLMLTEGRNQVSAFARDIVGNVASDTAEVNFNLSVPPVVKIVAPTPSQIIAATWPENSTRSFEFQISDDDTPVQDIKLIISLLDVDDKTRFAHLGCNFKNSTLWKQCPTADIEQSPLFTKPDRDGNVRFTVKVPTGWTESKRYVIAVTAIDRSGNAAINSTQEINVGYEVLAGRTYRGLGGSPTRMQRQGETTHMATDRKGSLILTNESIKVHPFDRRTCRFFRSSDTDIQPFDCADAITRIYNVTSLWTYDSNRDVFFASTSPTSTDSERYLVEIDFNKRTMTPIFGGTGKIALTSTIAANALSTDYRAPNLYSNLSFDTRTGRLVFRAGSQIFTIDRNRQLKYLAGTAEGTITPPSVAGAPLSSIVLPRDDNAFAITKDGRILLVGSRQIDWPHGRGFGVQYILEASELMDASEVASLMRLTPTQLSSLNREDGKSGYANVLAYDPVKNRIYGALAWWTHAYLDLPPKGSLPSEYAWTYLTLDERLAGQPYELTDNNIFGEGAQTVTFPVRYSVLARHLAFLSAEYVYVTGDATGSIFSIDVASKTMERQVGFADSPEGSAELGMNAKVDAAISLCVDGGSILYNDYSGLKQIDLDTSGEGRHALTNKFLGMPKYPFKCDLESRKIYSLNLNRVQTYDMDNLVAAPFIRTDSVPYAYTGHYGLSNNKTALKRILTTQFLDGVPSVFHKAFISFAEWGVTPAPTLTRLLSAPDQFAIGVNYCNGNNTACAQAPLVNGAYDTSLYRIQAYFSQSERRHSFPLMAFDSTDTAAYACLNNAFIKIIPGSNKIVPFTVTVSGTNQTLTCSTTSAVFQNFGRDIYYSRGSSPTIATLGKGIYKLDVSSVESKATATATLVSIRNNVSMPTGVYSDFSIAKDYLYLSDRQTGRILRVPR